MRVGKEQGCSDKAEGRSTSHERGRKQERLAAYTAAA
jgi:hypothetical protein